MIVGNQIEKIEDYLITMKEWAGSIREFDWYIKKSKEYRDGLFSYAKFKIGEYVILKEDPIITETISWGWMGHKDILIKGAKAKVSNIDFCNKKFRYDLLFSEEKGTFSFYEDNLEKFEVKICKECGKITEDTQCQKQ